MQFVKGNGQAVLRCLTVQALVFALAACGSSTPRQAETRTPTTVVAAVEPGVAPTPQTAKRAEAMPAGKPDSRRRRSRDEEPEVAAAALGPDAPIPDAALASYQRALVALRDGNWLEAELELEGLIAEYPGYAGPHVNLALVYKQDGRGDEARAELDQALEIAPLHPAANTELGILLREQGEFAAAEQAYRRALQGDPNHALAHYNLGVLLDVYLKRTAEALDHYEAYQTSLAEPNEIVGRWIIDLRRRVGADAARVAKEDDR